MCAELDKLGAGDKDPTHSVIRRVLSKEASSLPLRSCSAHHPPISEMAAPSFLLLSQTLSPLFPSHLISIRYTKSPSLTATGSDCTSPPPPAPGHQQLLSGPSQEPPNSSHCFCPCSSPAFSKMWNVSSKKKFSRVTHLLKPSRGFHHPQSKALKQPPKLCAPAVDCLLTHLLPPISSLLRRHQPRSRLWLPPRHRIACLPPSLPEPAQMSLTSKTVLNGDPCHPCSFPHSSSSALFSLSPNVSHPFEHINVLYLLVSPKRAALSILSIAIPTPK